METFQLSDCFQVNTTAEATLTAHLPDLDFRALELLIHAQEVGH
jgi:hypothetical protein